MTFKTYEINVDLVNDISMTSAIRFSQNDRNSAKLLLTITNKGAELDLSQAKSVRMSFKKPDGTRVFQNDCQPINALKGKYQILLKTQTLTSIGNVIAQIHIEEEDRILDTQKFLFVVNESLAGDGAVESTNDFTIIKKALELGEKFKNVDFDPIIKAGELATGALPKAGGTMTGALTMDIEKNLVFKSKDSQFKLRGQLANNKLVLQSTSAAGVNKFVLDYDSDTDTFNLNAANTNLVKKTGDTMTGDIRVEKNLPAIELYSTGQKSKVRMLYNAGVSTNNGFQIETPDGKAFLRKEGESKWSEILTKGKDGRADLTLTDNATQFGTFYTPVATRRGDIVTMRMAIIRNSNDNGIITILPSDMRPIDGLTSTILATDGTASELVVRSNGEVEVVTKNKTFRITLTFAVD